MADDAGRAALCAESSKLAEALSVFSMGLMQENSAPDAAIEAYLRAIALKPAYELLFVRAAMLYIRQGVSDKALALLEEACRQNPRSVAMCLYQAQVYQALNNPEQALKTVRRAIVIDPENSGSYLRLAQLHLQAGNEKSAVADLQDALKHVADKISILRLLGDIFLKQGLGGQDNEAVARAIDYYEQSAELPSDENSLAYEERLGDLYLLTRQFEKARLCFQDLAARYPGNPQLPKKLAMCYIALDRKDKALELVKQLVEQAPHDAQLRFSLVELYEELGETANAIASLRVAIELGPMDAQPYHKLALHYMSSDPEQARQTLQEGLKRFPDDRQLASRLIQLQLSDCRPQEALRTFAYLHDLLKNDADMAWNQKYFLDFGAVAQANGRYDLAELLYEKAGELAPDQEEPYIRLALLHLVRGETDCALNMIGEAAFMFPENFEVWYYFGLLHNRDGLYDIACGAFERMQKLARNVDPEPVFDSMFYFNFGIACERTGRFEQAVSLFERAIALNPENADALNYLAYMWAEKGICLEQAMFYIRHALDLEPENGAFLDTLGWILYRQRRYAEAYDQIEAAYYFAGPDPVIMEHLGDVLHALGRTEEALVWWRRSKAAQPDNTPLQSKIEGVHGHD